MPSGKAVSYTYDSLDRLQQYQIGTTTPIAVDYSYALSERNESGQSTYQTTKIHYETVGDLVTKYEYDSLGNITSISEKQTDGSYALINSYEYDELSQLIRENDKNQNKTKVYTYDLGGNITSINEYDYTEPDIEPVEVQNTITYDYTDSNWKDKLTSYNGQTITYDEIGNPLSYNGYTYDWDNGRELKSITGNGLTASYTYDETGLRVTKTVNGIKTNYEYLNGQLLYEKKGSTELHYMYDANGSLKGIQTVDGGTVNTYYVVTNTRGDVTQIYDTDGMLQLLYTYDSWGKILSIKDGNGNEITSDTNIGKLNSLRYRSYYYDTETGLYYLQSRYYNPELCRMLNADAYINGNVNMIENNMFAYSSSNPVNYFDPTGNFVETFIDIASIGYSGYNLYKKPSWKNGAYLVWDVGAAVVPFVPGSYVATGVKAISKADDVVDFAKGAGKVLSASDAAKKIVSAKRTESALKTDIYHRAASYISKSELAKGKTFRITGKDGIKRTLLQVGGKVNGKTGIFEYILEPNGKISHQLLYQGG